MKKIAERYDLALVSDVYLEGGGHYRLEVHQRIWEAPPGVPRPDFSVAYWNYRDESTLELAHLGWVEEFDAETALAAGLRCVGERG